MQFMSARTALCWLRVILKCWQPLRVSQVTSTDFKSLCGRLICVIKDSSRQVKVELEAVSRCPQPHLLHSQIYLSFMSHSTFLLWIVPPKEDLELLGFLFHFVFCFPFLGVSMSFLTPSGATNPHDLQVL